MERRAARVTPHTALMSIFGRPAVMPVPLHPLVTATMTISSSLQSRRRDPSRCSQICCSKQHLRAALKRIEGTQTSDGIRFVMASQSPSAERCGCEDCTGRVFGAGQGRRGSKPRPSCDSLRLSGFQRLTTTARATQARGSRLGKLILWNGLWNENPRHVPT
jgi:hypothetical protein